MAIETSLRERWRHWVEKVAFRLRNHFHCRNTNLTWGFDGNFHLFLSHISSHTVSALQRFEPLLDKLYHKIDINGFTSARSSLSSLGKFNLHCPGKSFPYNASDSSTQGQETVIIVCSGVSNHFLYLPHKTSHLFNLVRMHFFTRLHFT